MVCDLWFVVRVLLLFCLCLCCCWRRTMSICRLIESNRIEWGLNKFIDSVKIHLFSISEREWLSGWPRREAATPISMSLLKMCSKRCESNPVGAVLPLWRETDGKCGLLKPLFLPSAPILLLHYNFSPQLSEAVHPTCDCIAFIHGFPACMTVTGEPSTSAGRRPHFFPS